MNICCYTLLACCSQLQRASCREPAAESQLQRASCREPAAESQLQSKVRRLALTIFAALTLFLGLALSLCAAFGCASSEVLGIVGAVCFSVGIVLLILLYTSILKNKTIYKELYRKAEEEIGSLSACNSSLKAENSSLKAENSSLKAEQNGLRSKNQLLESENEALKTSGKSSKKKTNNK